MNVKILEPQKSKKSESKKSFLVWWNAGRSLPEEGIYVRGKCRHRGEKYVGTSIHEGAVG